MSKTLAVTGLDAIDAGLAALIRAFAHEIDANAEREVRWERIMRKLEREDDPESYDALMAARGQLASRATLDRIGGRLQSGLVELRATPRARPVAPPRAPSHSSLGRLRLAAGTDYDGPDDDGPQPDYDGRSRDERAAREFLARDPHDHDTAG
ncbi:MAG TPA: hypothetical protein VIU11_14395 [Nakamurella sp.]